MVLPTTRADGAPARPPDPVIRDIAGKISTPEGYRVEILEGVIVVSPPPLVRHAAIASRLARAVTTDAIELVSAVTVRDERTGDDLVPDVLATSTEALARDAGTIPPDLVLLVAEIVGPLGGAVDRVTKASRYALSGIPLCLLVEPAKRRTTLYSHPEDGEYLTLHRVPFGHRLPLPDPFGVDLDTGEF
ncbi:Uma2 family endonuclease [Allostreptomyces psammosilenae]|uniref:Uma2 family endonuclease n=1 Tax=Allostreptomyces psammosilenae TaxID=1892865 RepID=A0A853A1Y7_9ACTN|nr:Uma2 family endonuclease [Allostreptomyces psammosilenae]NYI08147.1 Uma2 family endonuclease [Allostreptomyces psammosilenae]